MKANMVEIKHPTQGLLGYLHEIDRIDPESLLVFQLPRATNQLSAAYLEGVLESTRKILPEGRKMIVIGCDINIYEIAGPDAVMLKLRGLI